MKLGANWFYRPRLDEELKSYETLAFEQYLESALKQKALVEAEEELQQQLTIITEFKETLSHYDEMSNGKSFIEGYSSDQDKQSDHSLDIIQSITDFFIDKISPYGEKFKHLRAEAEEAIHVHPVGILPLYQNEGWMILEGFSNATFQVYYYDISKVFRSAGKPGFTFKFVEETAMKDPVKVKLDLVKRYGNLPQPSTWLVQSTKELGVQTTYVPVALEKIARLI